jgi:hypothetical protein
LITRSYAEFVLMAKEISTLENDMLELKDSLSEWRNMPTLLNIEEKESVASASIAGKPSHICTSMQVKLKLNLC